MADVKPALERKQACSEAMAMSVPQVEVPAWLFWALLSRAGKGRLLTAGNVEGLFTLKCASLQQGQKAHQQPCTGAFTPFFLS